MLHRRFQALGIAPALAYCLLLLAFLAFSFFLFYKTQYAHYILVFVALLGVYNWSETRRNDFLLSVFTKKDYRTIRFIENTAVALPFSLFLCYKNAYLTAFCLLVATNVLALIRVQKGSFFTMPTPFYRYPFEFTVGFRQSWLAFLGLYALAIIGVSVGNFNLSLAALGFVGLFAMGFYSRLEPDFYIWIFNTKPAYFLIQKTKIAAFYTFLLGFPIILLVLCAAPNLLLWTLGIPILSICYVFVMILAKYAAYPSEISLPMVFILIFSLLFPPFLIVLLPFLYFRAIRRLSVIL
jgi:hypothetical protein